LAGGTDKMSEEEKFLDPVEMVDISPKPVVRRVAEAVGEIRLQPETVVAIKRGEITKGSVLAAAEIAGIVAAKRTAELIPLCHHIPLSQVNLRFEVAEAAITSTCSVTTDYKTGVEMEALVGVTTALLTIWDMVKYLEKDAEGAYPHTRIGNIRVTKKWKEE